MKNQNKMTTKKMNDTILNGIKTFFFSRITINNRQIRGCSKNISTFNGNLTTNNYFLRASSLFYILSSTEYFEEHLIQAIDKELIKVYQKNITFDEFYYSLGVWFIISFNSGFTAERIFLLQRKGQAL